MPTTIRRPASFFLLATLVFGGLERAPAFAQTEAEALSTSFRNATRKVLPAVVTVRAIGGLRQWEPVPGALPFGFGNRGFDPEVLPRIPEGGGSGVIIDAAKGFVLTNDHVVQNATRVVVVLHDGHERVASQVRRDPKSDLALLVIDNKGLTQAEWGDSTPLDTGDWVLAIGQPFGLSGTVTAGIVSGKGRGIGMAMYEDLIQTDAAINPGNSGGPLVNLKGEVVGINTAMKTVRGGYDGIGFAIPSSRARRVVADLAETGRVRRSYLGINIGPLDRQTLERVDQPGAVVITAVTSNSPASDAGLRVGDILLQHDGKPINGASSLQNAIEVAPEGQPITLLIERDGQRREIKATPKTQPESFGLRRGNPFEESSPLPPALGDDLRIRPPQMPSPLEIPGAGVSSPSEGLRETSLRTTDVWFPTLGLRLSEPTPVLARRFRVGRPVSGLIIVGIDPEGPADRAHLKMGMIVTDVDKHSIETLADFREAVAKCPPDRELVVRVIHDAKAEFLTIPKARENQDRDEPASQEPNAEKPAAQPDQR